jgi:hypothetical protein
MQELILEEVDALVRCPAESKQQATQEVLRKSKPRLKATLEALDTIGRIRRFTEVELAR